METSTEQLQNRLQAIEDFPLTLAEKIEVVFGDLQGAFNLQMIYDVFKNEKKSTIRGRIYDDLHGKGLVVKLAKGVYKFQAKNDSEGIILEGDAKKLEMIKSDSIHLIIADHPYPISTGTNRNFNESYKDTTFRYTLEDFENQSPQLLTDVKLLFL